MRTEAVDTRQQIDTTVSLIPTVIDGDRVRVGDLVLDRAASSVTGRNLAEIKLTRIEFVVLATLINSAGRIVSTDDMLGAVSKIAPADDPAIIDTYVKYLRKILTEAKSEATIDNIAGAGIRLLP